MQFPPKHTTNYNNSYGCQKNSASCPCCIAAYKQWLMENALRLLGDAYDPRIIELSYNTYYGDGFPYPAESMRKVRSDINSISSDTSMAIGTIFVEFNYRNNDWKSTAKVIVTGISLEMLKQIEWILDHKPSLFQAADSIQTAPVPSRDFSEILKWETPSLVEELAEYRAADLIREGWITECEEELNYRLDTLRPQDFLFLHNITHGPLEKTLDKALKP